MSRLDRLIDHYPLPTWRIVAWPVALLTLAFAAWAAVAKLDEVSIAAGEIAPRGKVKIVQHLEGGIIEKLFVREGARVAAGDLLIRLDLATSGVNTAELQARLDGARLKRARLIAESEGRQPEFPPDAAERQPSLAKGESRLFKTRKAEHASALAVLAEQIRQRKLEVEELLAKRAALRRNLALGRQRLKMSESLLAEGLTARMEHLELQAEVEAVAGELEKLRPALPRARAAVAESEQRSIELRRRLSREAEDELDRVAQQIAELEEVVATANDQQRRADIRSPIDGVVKQMRFHTIGGVVSPGEPILEIVPIDDTLIVEARLSPVDRGHVREGQPAMVKVSTYDFFRYGGLDGIVTYVAPDSTTSNDGVPYFQVIVETGKSYLGDEANPLPISPGMQAVVDIHTGKKTVLEYLLKPILTVREEAFRER